MEQVLARPHRFATPSAVFGLTALAIVVVPVLNLLTYPLGIVGIVLGTLALRDHPGEHHPGDTAAVVGIVAGCASLLIVSVLLHYGFSWSFRVGG